MRYSLRELIIDKITGEWGNEPIDGQGYNILRTTNFTNTGTINLEKVVRRNIPEDKVNKKHLKCGDIIIEKSGGSPNQPVGRVVFFDIKADEKYLCNNFTAILRPDVTKVFPKYFFYRLHLLHTRGCTLKYQNKTTGIINLKLDNYLEEKIDIPAISEQIHISGLLSKAESLIAKRKESIRLLDEFLKSTFLEMFGDPVRNEKGWKLSELGYVLSIKHGFAFRSENFATEGEYVLLTPGNYYEEGGYRDRADKQKYYVGEFPRDYLLNEGDLLIAMTEQAAGLLGSAIIIPESNKFLHNQRLGLVKFDSNKCNIHFLFFLFNLKSIRFLIHAKATGIKVRHTSPRRIQKISVGIPPIKLQAQFAQIVEKTSILKTQYQQSLQELENLYGSLSQKAFKGGVEENVEFAKTKVF